MAKRLRQRTFGAVSADESAHESDRSDRPGMRVESVHLPIVMRPRTHGLRLMHLAARCVELVKLSALAALPNQFASCGIKAVTLPRWSAIMSSADSPLSVISFALVWTRRKG